MYFNVLQCDDNVVVLRNREMESTLAPLHIEA
jgi:hypothetical protein